MTLSRCVIIRLGVYPGLGPFVLLDTCVTPCSLTSFLTLIWRSPAASYYRLGRFTYTTVGMVFTGCRGVAYILNFYVLHIKVCCTFSFSFLFLHRTSFPLLIDFPIFAVHPFSSFYNLHSHFSVFFIDMVSHLLEDNDEVASGGASSGDHL